MSKKRRPRQIKTSWKGPIKITTQQIKFTPKTVKTETPIEETVEQSWTGFDNT